MEKESLNDDVMNEASGGTLDETVELARFINAHGGDISFGRRMEWEIIDWFKKHGNEFGLGSASIQRFDETPNIYTITDEKGNYVRIGNKELLEKLKQIYD